MIPGDIDLTENLDFRKRVRKELPQLPDKWKKEDNTLASNYYTINTSINSLPTIHINNTEFITYFNNDIYGEQWEILDRYNNTINITYNNGTSNVTYSTNSYYNDYTYTTYDYNTSTRNASYKMYYLQENFKTDIFGNEIFPEPEIPQFPWSTSYREPEIPKLPLSLRRSNSFKDNWNWRKDEVIPRMPKSWYDKLNLNEEDELYYDLTDMIKSRICWLADKSKKFIKEYFDKFKDGEAEQDMSYLTNMSWIRVKDAVIEDY